MSFRPTGDKNALACLRRTMQSAWWGDSNAKKFAQPPTILNGESVTAVNVAGTGVVSLIGADASDQIVYGIGNPILLTAAQILTLNTVPVALIPAPGAGKAIILEQFVMEMIRTATAFAAGGTVAPVYHGSTSQTLTAATLAATFVNGAVGSEARVLTPATAGTLALSANTGIDLFAATANFTTGTGTAKVWVQYTIVTL